MDRRGQACTRVELVAIEGARHKFDADDIERLDVRAALRTWVESPLEIGIDTIHTCGHATLESGSGQRRGGILHLTCSRSTSRLLQGR